MASSSQPPAVEDEVVYTQEDRNVIMLDFILDTVLTNVVRFLYKKDDIERK